MVIFLGFGFEGIWLLELSNGNFSFGAFLMPMLLAVYGNSTTFKIPCLDSEISRSPVFKMALSTF